MKKLKSGIALYAASRNTSTDGYLCGTPDRLIPISSGEYAEACALALGNVTLGNSTPGSLTERLDRAGFLDHEIGRISLTERYSQKALATDAAYIQMRARVVPELAQTTWLPSAVDGGVAYLTARAKVLIEISGRNRVATLLLSLLISSGFTQTRFSADTKSAHPQIADSDIAIGGITPRDIGSLLSKRESTLRHEISLFPLDKSCDYDDERSIPDLIVHFGDVDPHRYATWMARGQKFLHIPDPVADTAQVGPLVIPGTSPCIRCLRLTQDEIVGTHGENLLARVYNDLEGKVEYPVIAAHYVAAIAATMITQWCATLETSPEREVAGKVIFYHYQSPATSLEVAIARHPLCGCAFH